MEGGRADAIEMQYLLLWQDVAKPLHRCVLVKAGILDLDIADGTVAPRSKVGVEAYKRLRATVFLGDVDPFGWLESSFLGAVLLCVCNSAESASLFNQ